MSLSNHVVISAKPASLLLVGAICYIPVDSYRCEFGKESKPLIVPLLDES